MSPLATLENSNLSKISNSEYFLTILFSSESWDIALYKNSKGGPKGGPPRAIFWYKKSKNFENFKKISKFQTKIRLPVVPLLVPLIHFSKNQYLSFHWEKKSLKNIRNSRFYKDFSESVEKRSKVWTVVSRHDKPFSRKYSR